jgi:hypothetical protein
VLLLRNGQVLRGEITKAGDYYVVILGPASEVRMPATEVEASCRSLEDAFLWKFSHLEPTNHLQRVGLVEWCLRYHLYDQAEEQIEILKQVNADHPRLKLLEQRLATVRQQAQAPTTASKPAFNVATVSSEQLEATARELPEGSVEKFTAVVQPLLLNRCGANGCHGPNSKNGYQLLKPALGQVANRRFTQRNLYSTLQFVDRDEPQNSKLFLLPQQRHGNTAAPVFDEHTQSQLDELARWIAMTVPKPLPTAPASINPTGVLLSPAENPQSRANINANPATPIATPTNPAAATPAQPASAATGDKQAADLPFKPRDPFDPEIFNRLYLSAKPASDSPSNDVTGPPAPVEAGKFELAAPPGGKKRQIARQYGR